MVHERDIEERGWDIEDDDDTQLNWAGQPTPTDKINQEICHSHRFLCQAETWLGVNNLDSWTARVIHYSFPLGLGLFDWWLVGEITILWFQERTLNWGVVYVVCPMFLHITSQTCLHHSGVHWLTLRSALAVTRSALLNFPVLIEICGQPSVHLVLTEIITIHHQRNLSRKTTNWWINKINK